MLAFPSGKTAYRQVATGLPARWPKCSGSATATRWRGTAVLPHCPQRGNIDPWRRTSAGRAFLARKAFQHPRNTARWRLCRSGPRCITAHTGWRRASAKSVLLVGLRKDRGNVTSSRRTGLQRSRSAGANQMRRHLHGSAKCDNGALRHLASSALTAMPRRPVFAQTPVEPGQATRITPLQYRAQTLLVGTFSKHTSQLAMVQAVHPKVRQFAVFRGR